MKAFTTNHTTLILNELEISAITKALLEKLAQQKTKRPLDSYCEFIILTDLFNAQGINKSKELIFNEINNIKEKESRLKV